MPDDWQLLTSDAGDVRLALPPDFGLLLSNDGVEAQLPHVDGELTLDVWAALPADSQPEDPGEAAAWLDSTGFLPRTIGSTHVGERDEGSAALPEGPALVVGVTVQPGSEPANRVVAYAIDTADGMAILRFVGAPGFLEERADDLDMISRLVEFGAAPSDR